MFIFLSNHNFVTKPLLFIYCLYHYTTIGYIISSLSGLSCLLQGLQHICSVIDFFGHSVEAIMELLLRAPDFSRKKNYVAFLCKFGIEYLY